MTSIKETCKEGIRWALVEADSMISELPFTPSDYEKAFWTLVSLLQNEKYVIFNHIGYFKPEEDVIDGGNPI